MSLELSNSTYDEFINLISSDKIYNFQKECIKYFEYNNQKNKSRIPKSVFINIFQQLFSPMPSFTLLYELFFEKFKCQKLLFKKEIKEDLYSLKDVISMEEIDIYNTSLALLSFYKSDFDTKIKILFNLSDFDDDGYINEREIKKMVFSYILLFSQYESQFKTNSNLIHRSIANSKANKVYFSIMYTPGGLSRIISKEKFINFDIFYNSISKIKDYKFSLFPFQVSLKDYLNKPKIEIEYSLPDNVIPDYVNITNSFIQKMGEDKNYNFNIDNNKLRNFFDIQILPKKNKYYSIFKVELRKKSKKKNKSSSSKNILTNFQFENQKIGRNKLSSNNLLYKNHLSNNASESNIENSTNETVVSMRNKLNDINQNINMKYEKADYEKFRTLKFPPCKLISLTKRPKINLPSLEKRNKNIKNINSCSFILKSLDDIRDEINKISIKKKFVDEREKYNLNQIENLIYKKSISMKKILSVDNKIYSHNFFKYSIDKKPKI